jgi:hypothetical protein
LAKYFFVLKNYFFGKFQKMTDFLFGFYQFLMNYLFGKFQKVKKKKKPHKERY